MSLCPSARGPVTSRNLSQIFLFGNQIQVLVYPPPILIP